MFTKCAQEAQWLSGRVLDWRPRGGGFKPHWRHYVVSLSKNINPSLVLVQLTKTHPFITKRLLMGCKESNQTNKQSVHYDVKLTCHYYIIVLTLNTITGSGPAKGMLHF